jgi:hypothetical protein
MFWLCFFLHLCSFSSLPNFHKQKLIFLVTKKMYTRFFLFWHIPSLFFSFCLHQNYKHIRPHAVPTWTLIQYAIDYPWQGLWPPYCIWRRTVDILFAVYCGSLRTKLLLPYFRFLSISLTFAKNRIWSHGLSNVPRKLQVGKIIFFCIVLHRFVCNVWLGCADLATILENYTWVFSGGVLFDFSFRFCWFVMDSFDF